jgi:tagatose 1,6-diphosphate aldolase
MSKERHLQHTSSPAGIIAALAIDQRSSLERALRHGQGAGSAAPDLECFKELVTAELAGHASAVLLDPQFGLAAAGRRGRAGLLLAYEESGYDPDSSERLPSPLPGWSVARLAAAGANGVKLLVYYDPFDEDELNERKRAVVERVGAECAAEGLPLFLEPLTYLGGAGKGEAASLKPELVRRTVEEFSKDRYRVDVLKIELPLVPEPGLAEAKRAFRDLDSAARRPYIFLSGGVDMDSFTSALELAGESGARYSGVLCGRATWKGAVAVYAERGPEAARSWLREEGVRNIERLNEVVGRYARPWWESREQAASEPANEVTGSAGGGSESSTREPA